MVIEAFMKPLKLLSRPFAASLLRNAPLIASFVALRAWNAEGYSEWSPRCLVLHRQVLPEATLVTWGVSEDGRLGRGLEALEVVARPEIEALKGFEACRVSRLSCGAHSALLSGSDRLFLWGSFLADEQEGEEVDMLVEPQEQVGSRWKAS